MIMFLIIVAAVATIAAYSERRDLVRSFGLGLFAFLSFFVAFALSYGS